MFRCCDCGYLFKDGEQAIWYENQGECHGRIAMEKFGGCPICKGDYEEVHQCQECDEWHAEDELYSGWCEKCLRETINYDTFFEYCEAYSEYNVLDEFVMYELFDMVCPKKVSDSFHELMIQVYKSRCSEEFDFLGKCIHFVLDDNTHYADWLNKREAKK